MARNGDGVAKTVAGLALAAGVSLLSWALIENYKNTKDTVSEQRGTIGVLTGQVHQHDVRLTEIKINQDYMLRLQADFNVKQTEMDKKLNTLLARTR